MKRLRKLLKQPAVATAVISLLVLGAVLAIRAQGWLQRAELIAYDNFIRAKSKPDSTDPRMVLIGMTESDLTTYGYPLDDRKLAQVFRKIDALEPCVIGIDLYRDLPEPRDKSLYPELEAAYKELKRVVSIERVGYFKGPPALADEPDRIVANNLPRDYTIDGYYRRAPIALEGGLEAPFPSYSLALTLAYLQHKNVEFAFEGEQAPVIRLGKTIIPRLTRNAGGYVNLPVSPRPPGAPSSDSLDDYEYLAAYEAPLKYRVNPPKTASETAKKTDVAYDYSFADVLEGRVPAEAVKDKIVLVATVMESIKDSSPTPIDENLRGIHIHATLIHQLLAAAFDGRPPMTWWSETAEVLWIAALIAIGGLLAYFLRSPWKLVPALLVVLGALGWGAWYAFDHGTWILLAAPALGCFVTATVVTSFMAFLERTERDTMEHLFARHVSEEVVDTLWENREEFLEGGRLKPQRLTCTVMFTDLKGFSTISEGMEPAELMNWMNEYMNAVARHVDLHNGVVNSYIGDAIMALFGAPAPSLTEEEMNRDAQNAVRCALAMRGEMVQLNENWTKRGMPNVGMRIGIYTGPLVAGSLGSADRLMFTVLGDTTNTAARLEGAGKELAEDEYNKLCTILIGDATLQRLEGKFATKQEGEMALKGKANKILTHSVLYEIKADVATPTEPSERELAGVGKN